MFQKCDKKSQKILFRELLYLKSDRFTNSNIDICMITTFNLYLMHVLQFLAEKGLLGETLGLQGMQLQTHGQLR